MCPNGFDGHPKHCRNHRYTPKHGDEEGNQGMGDALRLDPVSRVVIYSDQSPGLAVVLGDVKTRNKGV